MQAGIVRSACNSRSKLRGETTVASSTRTGAPDGRTRTRTDDRPRIEGARLTDSVIVLLFFGGSGALKGNRAKCATLEEGSLLPFSPQMSLDYHTGRSEVSALQAQYIITYGSDSVQICWLHETFSNKYIISWDGVT